jgi:copper transport protein
MSRPRLQAIRLWLLLLPAVLLAPSEASAHAALVASDPPAGAVLRAPPASVGLVFDEPVSPLVVTLFGPDGSVRAIDGVTAADDRVTVPMPPDAASGTRWLAWRVVSADGHPVHGTLAFSIGAPGGMKARLDGVGSPAPIVAGLWLSQLGLYVSLFFGAAGLAFAALFMADPARARRPIRFLRGSTAAIGSVSILAAVAFQGLDALGRPLSGVLSPEIWRAALSTSFGRTAGIAALAILAAFLASRGGAGRTRRLLALSALAGPGLALAASGHAADVEPQWLMRPLLFLHATAVAFWIGALLPLALALRSGEGAAPLARFSRIIPWVFASLVATGLAIAVATLGRPSALLETAYGRVLSAKLATFALLAALAFVNRFFLTGPTLAGDRRAARRLARSIAAEVLLALVIFGIVGLWRLTPPPRDAAPARIVELHLHGESAMAEIEAHLAPGVTRLDITPLDAEGVPFTPLGVAVAIEPAGDPAEAVRGDASAGEGGNWHFDAPPLAAGGRWKVTLELLVSDFDKARISGELDAADAE